MSLRKQPVCFPDNFFDSVCAFLNRNGGTILLGVSDDKTIEGVNPNSIVFSEEDVFISKVPLDYHNLKNGGLNGGLNGGQQKVFLLIQENEGIKGKEISIRLNMPVDTIDKHIKVLINKNLIEHRGSKKTGGYFLCPIQ